MPKKAPIRKVRLPGLFAAIRRYQKSFVRCWSLEAQRDRALLRVLRSDWRSQSATNALHSAQLRLRKAWIDREHCVEAILRLIEPPVTRSVRGAGVTSLLAPAAPPLGVDVDDGQNPSGQTSPSVSPNPPKEGGTTAAALLENPLAADAAREAREFISSPWMVDGSSIADSGSGEPNAASPGIMRQ